METLLSTAQYLASCHRDVDPDITKILFFPDPENERVRILEVSTSAAFSNSADEYRYPADSTGRDHGIRFPVSVILLTPREWELVISGELSLPPRWFYISSVEI